MKQLLFISLWFLISQITLSASDDALTEGLVNPGFYEKPAWFKQSFLDLQEDLADANENQKRIMLYFHQDGCPYCKKLLIDNFSREDIVKKMKQHFELLEINMWGDKTITLLTGEEISEKEFAKRMKVMFTPTLVVLDTAGAALFRMNGYYAPEKFSAVLDYLSTLSGTKSSDSAPQMTFTQFYQQKAKQKTKSQSSAGLHSEKFIRQEKNLQALIENSQQPVMLLFEQESCVECDELHGDVFRRLPVYKQLKQFVIAQIDINSTETIITPNGQSMSQVNFAKMLNIQYTPSLLFYDPAHQVNSTEPVFRSEAYLKSFHFQALFDYILTKSYISEPEFQRFVQQRADRMHEAGVEVDLWE